MRLPGCGVPTQHPVNSQERQRCGRMSDREILLSPEGKKKLEDDLNYLKLVRRKEVAARIKAAREFGDLSENAEYEDAKNEQAFVEGEILAYEKRLRHARIVENGSTAPGVVGVGSVVTVYREGQGGKGTEEKYTIVGSQEADPLQKRISYESPVGQALMGQKIGSEVQVQVRGTIFKYKVKAVEA